MAHSAHQAVAGNRLGTGLLEHHDAGPSWPRVWNHLAGGSDAYQVDREFAAAMKTAIPQIARVAQARLRARRRLIRYLAGRQRVDQFLVVGADLPLHAPPRDEVHTIARKITPASVTVYADKDPLVLSHARALLCIDGACACVDADPGDPVAVLTGASETLDLSRPVAVVMIGALESMDDRDAEDALRGFGDVLQPGSHLAVIHLTATRDLMVELTALCGQHHLPFPHLRSPQDIAALLGQKGTKANNQSSRRPGDIPDGLAVWCATTRIGGAA